MDANTQREIDYWKGKLNELKGGVVRDAVVDIQPDLPVVFGIRVLMPDKSMKIVWILSDEEGNDGGRVEIQTVYPLTNSKK